MSSTVAPRNRRVLFQVRNRRGLGHLMRVQNIATALRDRSPQLDLHFHAALPPTDELWDPTLFVTDDTVIGWPERARTCDPDVVVYDTVLPEANARLVSDRAKYVFVMRRMLEDRGAELFDDPFLERFEIVIVPHTETEFGQRIPNRLAGRTHFVGTIARQPHPASAATMRARFGLGDAEMLLTSTVGGGGFQRQADRFFEAVLHTGRAVAAALPNVRHVVVLGPNYHNTSMAADLAEVPGTIVVGNEPRMVDLLAASTLVVAEGGYNTVNEVRLGAVPAVFVPSDRGLDDQIERVRRLEQLGAAAVWLPDGAPATLATTVIDLLGNEQRRREMRSNHQMAPVELGNERAAELIAAVAA